MAECPDEALRLSCSLYDAYDSNSWTSFITLPSESCYALNNCYVDSNCGEDGGTITGYML